MTGHFQGIPALWMGRFTDNPHDTFTYTGNPGLLFSPFAIIDETYSKRTHFFKERDHAEACLEIGHTTGNDPGQRSPDDYLS